MLGFLRKKQAVTRERDEALQSTLDLLDKTSESLTKLTEKFDNVREEVEQLQKKSNVRPLRQKRA